MQNLKRLVRVRDLVGNEDAATAIEYGLIAALIALASIISIQLLGINLADTFWTLANTIGGAL